MTLHFTRTAFLAIALSAAGAVAASAQSDGSGGTSGGSSTGGVGWTPTPPDGGAKSGADKTNSNPSTGGNDRSAASGPDAAKTRGSAESKPDAAAPK